MERKFRATARTRVTKIAQTVDQLISSSQKSVMDCKIALAKLEYAEVRLLEADEAFNKTLTEDTVGTEFETIDEYNDLIIDRKVRLNECINELTIEVSRNESNNSERRIETPGLKIPKIDMMKFGGNVNEWISFWDQFVTIIHNNSGFSDIARFNYLRSLLYGKALDLVKGLLPSADSYEQAIKILTSEFGSKERIVESLMNELAGLGHVRNSNDTNRLRGLLNKFNSVLRSLESLRIDPNRYRLTARTNLLRCMPVDLRIEFFKTHCREDRDDNPNSGLRVDPDKKQIDELVNFFEAHVRAFERNVMASTSTTTSNRFHSGIGNAGQSSASSLLTLKSSCVFCRSVDHESAKCDKSMLVSERKSILSNKRRCFRCAKPNHTSKTCKERFLKCDRCGLRHLTILCDPEYKRKMNNEQSSSTNTTNLNVFDKINSKQVFLQTARVVVKTKENRKKQIRIVLDGGSQLTFVKETVVDSIKYRIIGEQKLSISTFGGSGMVPRFYKKVSIDLGSRYGGDSVSIVAVVVPEICLSVLSSPKQFNFESQYRQFLWADCGSNVVDDDDISILVGADCYWRIVTGEIERITDRLTAINTHFGWTLHGETNSIVSSNECNLVTALSVINDIDLSNDVVTNFWDLEAIGIHETNNVPKDSEEFIQSFMMNNITLKDDRYCVALPWKCKDAHIDSNYFGAKLHLKYTIDKLQKDSLRLAEYHDAIMEYINNDVAEKTSEDAFNGKVYYMPHHPVYKYEKETTKIRIVFNASAHRRDELSLNELLDAGIPMNLEAIKLLLSFRFGSIAMTADIEKAFLQIALQEEDRDSHRFLWYDQLPSDGSNASLATYRMKRVTFGVTCSPFLLAVVIKKLFTDFNNVDQHLCPLIAEHFYVDDFIISVRDMALAESIFNIAKSLFSKVSMNLRKWASNDCKLQNKFGCEAPANKKLLGLFWNLASDELSVDLSSSVTYLTNESLGTITKRKALQFVARIYDPLGFLGPVTVRLKLFIQSLWKEKFDWDETLPMEFVRNWNDCIYDFEKLSNWGVDRCVDPLNVDSYEIHIFSDSSLKAYGTVAYVKSTSGNYIRTRLLYARNRLAPMKNEKNSTDVTIPRLELTACLIAARLFKFLKSSLRIEAKYSLWTDSQIAIAWINSDPRKLKPYISNRVKEIRSIVDPESWYYCSGKSNPADLLTRGLSSKEFLSSKLWRDGPPWLYNYVLSKTDHQKVVANTVVMETCDMVVRPTKEPIFPFDRFSNWRKIVNVTAYVFRFVALTKRSQICTTIFETEELRFAEKYWIEYDQSLSFYNEKKKLQKGVSVETSSSIVRLDPFLADGVIRARTRLQHSDLPYEFKNPIILNKNSSLAKKLLEYYHKELNHAGVSALIMKLRENFWVFGSRQLAKTIVNRCIPCRRLFAKPLMEIDGRLPVERLQSIRAFENVGLDFAGPLITDDGRKTYVLLFTCAVVRAVHLELCLSMSVDDFFCAFRKFIARRGVPKVIFSDNFKSFKRASLELKLFGEIMVESKFQKYIQNKSINWKFIVERAPWWGGWWERMVRTIKNSLKLSIGRQSLNERDLEVTLCEVESLINSRPLCCVGDDINELRPLTPNDFLIGGGVTAQLKLNDNFTLSQKEMVGFWQERQRCTQVFFKRWKGEYLGQLRSAIMYKNVKSQKARLNGIYVICDNLKPRLNWKLGMVTKLISAKDGKVRACELRLGNGQSIRRPIQLLYPLEAGPEC